MRLPKVLATAMLCASLFVLSPAQAVNVTPTVTQAGITVATPDVNPAQVVVEGKQLTLQINAQGRIELLGLEQPLLVDEGAEKTGGKQLALQYSGQHLYAVWWQKMDDASKRLFVRVSSDQGKTFAPIQVLNRRGGVLPKYSIAAQDDKIAIAYYDERDPRFQVYLNRSLDGGKTWLEQDIRLDSVPLRTAVTTADQEPFAIDPHLAVVQNQLVAVWKEKQVEASDQSTYTRVVSRVSSDWGNTWGEVIEIARSPEFITAEVVLSHQGQLVIIGYDIGHGLSAYRSKDAGKTWQALGTVPGSQEWHAASMLHPVVDGSTVGVVFTWEQQKRKYQVHFAALDLLAGAWRGESQRLDQKEIDATQAWRPALIALPSGQWVAAWEDSRYIRPSIFFRVSEDQGKTWSTEALPLDSTFKLRLEAPILALYENMLRVYFDHWRTDARQVRDYSYINLALKDGKLDLSLMNKPVSIDREQRLQRLKQRSNEFWNLRVQSKYAESYDYLDPAYRGLFTRVQFEANQGNLIFQSAELIDADFRESFGLAKVKLRVQIPPMMVDGKEFKMDSREDLVNTEWVWVDDDWYMVMFADSTRSKRYLTY